MKRKMLVIGIDGADYYLVRAFKTIWPFLSNFDLKLMKTTLPPKTPNAWISSVTGVNPGKHGVFDFFLDVDIKRKQLKYASIYDSKVKLLWHFLIENDVNVAIMNFPFMYPAPELKGGVFVGGMTVPREAKDYTYPRSLYKELNDLGYIVDVNDVMPKLIHMVKDKIRYLRILQEMMISRIKAVEYILKSFDIDFLFVVEVSLDRLLHWFIEDLQNSMTKSLSQLSRFEVELLRTVRLIDYLSRRVYIAFKRTLKERFPVLIYSDHGFKAVRKALLLNSILRKFGLIDLNPQPQSFLYQDVVLDIVQKSRLVSFVFDKVPSKIIRGVGWRFSPSRHFYEIFDISESSMLFYFSNYLWYNKYYKMNTKDRSEIHRVIMKIANILEKIGIIIIPKHYIYKGLMLPKIPPYIVVAKADNDLMPLSLIPIGSDITTIDLNSAYKYSIPSLSWRGNHTLNAVVMVKDLKIVGEQLSIYDIMPSILNYYNIDIPSYVDGRVRFYH